MFLKRLHSLPRPVRLLILVAVLGMICILLAPVPQPLFPVSYSTVVKSEEGRLLSATLTEDEQWRFPVSDSIPYKVRTSLLLFEDEYFPYHPGVNPISLFRATRQNIRAGRVVSGGSTLTMQTIRMALGNQPRTYFQKVLEIVSALKLELMYSKEEIVKAYADHAPYGGNIVGIQAASWRYFGRSPHQLSWAESAALAILPNDPSSVFPGKNQQVFLAKRNSLLNKLKERGYLAEDELFLAKEEPLPDTFQPIPALADHLLQRIIHDGKAGTEIITTLPFDLQRRAKKTVEDYSSILLGNQIHNAAALIIEIKTGNVLSYVGNVHNGPQHGGYVDVIASERSPGSLLKPFLYALALESGLIAPKQILPDIPVFYNGFAPQNFDKEYRGAVPADKALISSLNVPFVHLLMEYGYERFHKELKDMGFSLLDQPASHYGLSLILGGSETTLWEVTSAYAGLAREASLLEPSLTFHSHNYLKSDQDEMESTEGPEMPLSQASAVYALAAMKQLNRPYEHAGWEKFSGSQEIAWKTGTSYGFRDGWAIGMNGKYLVGVWVGNADGEGRPGLTGVGSAAPLMFQLFDLVGTGGWDKLHFGKSVRMCTRSGMIASVQCPDTEWLNLTENMQESRSCQYHTMVHLNASESAQVNHTCYSVDAMISKPWFVLPPVQAWYYKKNNPQYRVLPAFDRNCASFSSRDKIALIYPSKYSRIRIPLEQDGKKGLTIFEAAHQSEDAVLFWHVNEEYLGYTKGNHQKGVSLPNGVHTLTLIDGQGNEKIQRFEVVD